MANRGTRRKYDGRRPQGNGYYQGAGGRPGNSAKKRKRRRARLVKAAIAWAVCLFLVAAIAVGTVRVVSSVASSRKRQFRQEGIEKLESGDYAGAIEAFDTALEKSGKKAEGFNADVLQYRAEAEYRLRDYDAALHTYGLLAQMEPKNPIYQYAASMCYARLGDTDQAIASYEAGAALETEKTAGAGRLEALAMAGGACVDAREYEKAMSLYEEALKEGLKHGQIYNQMGLCQMALEDYQGALDSFEQGYETFVTGHNLGSGADVAQAAAALAGEAKDSAGEKARGGADGKAKDSANGKAKDDADEKARDGADSGAGALALDLSLLKELVYNRAVACEYLLQYEKALELFEDYVDVFGSNDDVEHEIAFLKTR